jgi:hypothetical protein
LAEQRKLAPINAVLKEIIRAWKCALPANCARKARLFDLRHIAASFVAFVMSHCPFLLEYPGFFVGHETAPPPGVWACLFDSAQICRESGRKRRMLARGTLTGAPFV